MVLVSIILVANQIVFLYIECPSQHYGMNCTGRCSGHCINNEPCDHVSGVCPSGCQDGYTGALCTDGKNFLFLL